MTNNTRQPDWNPTSDEVQRDQRAAYDDMRERCPVAWSGALQWSLFRHEDIVRALHDPATFSNAVSAHRTVPNGMDPPEHTVYRRIIEPYFSPETIQAFEPACRAIAAERVQAALAAGELELMDTFATLFAVQVQCAFTGWPAALHGIIGNNWGRRNYWGRSNICLLLVPC